MSGEKIKARIWTLGLEPDQRGQIERAIGATACCRDLTGQSCGEILAELEQTDAAQPGLIWVGGHSWLQIRESSPRLFLALQSVPLVLVLERNPGRELLEQALAAPALQILRAPFGKAQIFDVLNRVQEVQNLYGNLNRMSREIALDRELLERKSDVCSLLFEFFARINENSSACNLAAAVHQVLAEHCDLQALHLSWWGDSDQLIHILGLSAHCANAEAWRDFMAEQALRLHPGARKSKVLHWDGGSLGPRQGEGLLLPLEIRGQACGIMALQLARPLLGGRDMAQALDVVRKQLALALWEGAFRPDYFSVDLPTSQTRPEAQTWWALQ